MNDTIERFFRDIASRVDAEQVAEVHLFPPMRQGGMETGVAVLASVQAVPSGDDVEIADGAANVTHETMGPHIHRHVIYSARYRNTIKGPDRGHWEVDVTAEADAPLLTVDEVVRGVIKRAGEPFQPERISGDAFRSIIGAATPS